jgi:hypothetical protein
MHPLLFEEALVRDASQRLLLANTIIESCFVNSQEESR